METARRSAVANTEESHSSEEKQVRLLEFLQRNRKAVMSIRAYDQIIDSTRLGKEIQDQLKELEEIIQRESKGKLSMDNGFLCEIWDRGEEFQHHGRTFGNKLTGKVHSVKGCYFWWEEEENGQLHRWEVVDLDDGRSREYFMNMTLERKNQFVKRFANRQRGSIYYTEESSTFPECYVAFVTNDGEKFNIVTFVSHHAPLDGTNCLDPNSACEK